jgi:tetratricopeptide (TPR) repeat protein
VAAYHAYLRGKGILDGIRFSAGEWGTAVELLERAVELDPGFHEAYVALARAHSGFCHFNWDRSEERLARAKVAADRAFALKPDSPLSHVARGIYFYWGLKDYDHALEALDRALVARPHDAEILKMVAYVERRQGRFADAADKLLRCAELSPQDHGVCYDLCETFGLLGRYDEAVAWGEKGIQLAPDDGLQYLATGWVYLLAGDKIRASQLFEAYPGQADEELRSRRTLAALHTRDYPAALRMASELPEEVGDSQYYALNRFYMEGLVYLAMERSDPARRSFAAAARALDDAVAAKPDEANPAMARAVCWAALGRGEEAVEEAQRALTLFPANRDAWIRQWRLADLALVQSLAGRKDAAVATLAELLDGPVDVISPALLRITPLYDSLRDHPGYAALQNSSTP